MAQTQAGNARRRKLPAKKILGIKRSKRPSARKKLPSVFGLIHQSIRHIWQYKKPFIGLMVVYLFLVLLLVKGFSNNLDLPSLREEISQTITDNAFQQNIVLLGVVASGSSETPNETGNLYQTIIVIISVLAAIWLFRQSHDRPDMKFKIKQPFYEGMGQLIPFILVLCVVGLQLLPMVIGLGIFGTVQQNGLATTGFELSLWALLAIGLSLLTFYFMASSLFALIIVTLPQSTPVASLRSARKIVKYQRWVIIRKLFALGFIFSLISLLALFAIIAAIPGFAEFFVLIITAVFMPIVIGAWYKLYRALL